MVGELGERSSRPFRAPVIRHENGEGADARPRPHTLPARRSRRSAPLPVLRSGTGGSRSVVTAEARSLMSEVWLVVDGCWLLVAGCWLLITGCWLLATDYWLLLTGYSVREGSCAAKAAFRVWRREGARRAGGEDRVTRPAKTGRVARPTAASHSQVALRTVSFRGRASAPPTRA